MIKYQFMNRLRASLMTDSKTHQLLALGLLIGLLSTTVHSESKISIPSGPTLSARAYILQDADSGKILVEKNADQKIPPASLTKIMTVYVAFRELQNQNLALTDKVTVSKKAWKTSGSRMFIEVNSQVSVEDLLKGIIISSGNDASVALAEHIAGDENTFSQLMNQHAKRLGLLNTHFTNSMGLPDPNHTTTARDLALLTRKLIQEFPEYYKWHAQKEFSYNKITQHNRNNLLWRDTSIDGVKTGHTEEAGYCLVASAKREEMRLISVVMGTKSTSARANQNLALLNYGFRFFETHLLYKANKSLTQVRVWKGDNKKLSVGLKNDFYVTIPRRHYQDLKANLEIDEKIIAPINAEAEIGTLTISLAGDFFAAQPLVALQPIPKGSLFRILYDEALLLTK